MSSLASSSRDHRAEMTVQQFVCQGVPLVGLLIGQERFDEPDHRILPAADRLTGRECIGVARRVLVDLDPPVPQAEQIGQPPDVRRPPLPAGQFLRFRHRFSPGSAAQPRP